MSSVVRQIPVASHPSMAAVELQQMPGRQFMDAVKGCERIRNITKVEEIEQPIGINVCECGLSSEKGLDFRAKQKTSLVERIVQRLFAEAIACQQQTLAVFIPQPESKHSPKMVNTIRTVVLIEVHDHLSVTVCIELVTASFQLVSEFGEIVDFAIENDPDAAIFVVDGLMPGRQIDNAKPPHAQTHAA